MYRCVLWPFRLLVVGVLAQILLLHAQVTFLTQPSNSGNYEGRFASLGAGFNLPANTPYAVQWQKDGSNLVSSTHLQGATSVRRYGESTFSGTTAFGRGYLDIPDLRASDVGTYRAIVHVNGLSYTSNPANITLSTFVPKIPVIRSVAADKTVPVGTAVVTFRTEITASPDTTIQWSKDGVPFTDNAAAEALGYFQTNGKVSGDGNTFFDFVISPVYASSAGRYKVELKNSLGTAVSREIVVAIGPGTAPAFTAQPTPTTIIARSLDSATIRGFAASGNPTPTFFMAKNGVAFTPIFGTTYDFQYLQETDSGAYTIIASNSVSQVSSTPITVTVGAPPDAGGHTPTPMPIISSAAQLRGATLNATVFFGVDDHPSPAPYQMQFAATGFNFTIPAGGYLPAQTGTWSLDLTGAYGRDNKGNIVPTISVLGLKAEDGSFVNARFNLFYDDNDLNVWYDQPANLIHHFAHYTWTSLGASSGAPSITQPPTATTATEGSTTALQVFAAGAEPLTYQWQKAGVDISGATNRILSFTNVLAGDAGNYRVKVIGGAGGTATSSAVALTVASAVPPVFMSGPSDILGFVDDYTISSLVNLGMPTATGGQPVYPSDTPIKLEFKRGASVLKTFAGTFGSLSSANFYPGLLDSRGFNHLRKSDSGVYTATASVRSSSTNKNFTVTVLDQNDAPAYLVGRSVVNLLAGAGATLVYQVIGTQDDNGERPLINTVSYQWKKNGTPIAGAIFPYLDIRDATSAVEGQYTLMATAISGASSESEPITVRLVQPCSPPTSQSQLLGKFYSLVKSAEGSPWPVGDIGLRFAPTGSTYEVLANENHAAFSGNYTASAAGGGLSITLQSFKFSTGGSGTVYLFFNCTDGAFAFSLSQGSAPFAFASGSVSTTVPVELPAPVITVPPVAQSVALNAPATFSVTATVSNSLAITYQWKKGDTNITGATSRTFTIPNAALADAGLFSVVVTANGRSVTSTPVALSVTGSSTKSPLSVTVVGVGTVTPNLTLTNLFIGTNYTLTATPAVGFRFDGWSGTLNTNKTPLPFKMVAGMALTAKFTDIKKPEFTLAAPATGARLTNETLIVRGTAKDNDRVAAVKVKLNDGAFTAATGTTNWQRILGLSAGTNTIRVYAEDPEGNHSTTNTVIVNYIVTKPFTVVVVGKGTIAPNLHGKNLEIGKTYSMTATPAAGFTFSKWTGGINTNKAAVTFRMTEGLSATATFIDGKNPEIAIAKPLNNSRQTNATLSLQGTAKDNDRVKVVRVKINDGAFMTATGTTNWTAAAPLRPGTNTVLAFAEDDIGRVSTTNSIKVVFAVMERITVAVVGKGTLAPNLNGQFLEIGKTYSMNATPALGFKFNGWSGGAVTNKPALFFRMATALALTATFVDTNIPTVTITKPLNNTRVTNLVAALQGTAKDNDRVAEVRFNVNGGAWFPATGTNSWVASATLRSGTNTIRVYAVDTAGNPSKTNSLNVISTALPIGAPRSTPGELMAWAEGNVLSALFNSEIGRAYVVQTSDDLETWNDADTITAETAQTTVHIPIPTGAAARFYRIIEQPESGN